MNSLLKESHESSKVQQTQAERTEEDSPVLRQRMEKISETFLGLELESLLKQETEADVKEEQWEGLLSRPQCTERELVLFLKQFLF